MDLKQEQERLQALAQRLAITIPDLEKQVKELEYMRQRTIGGLELLERINAGNTEPSSADEGRPEDTGGSVELAAGVS